MLYHNKKNRTLLYDNLLLEAIFIISMVMVVEGVGEGWVMVFVHIYGRLN